MIIKRTLKNATWSFVEERQELTLRVTRHIDTPPDGVPSEITEEITLNRTYAFSLARFLIRCFFRMSMKRRKPAKIEEDEDV